MDRRHSSLLAAALLAALLLFSTPMPLTHTFHPVIPVAAEPRGSIMLSVERVGSDIIVVEHLRSPEKVFSNYSVAAASRLMINNTYASAGGYLFIMYSGRDLQVYPRITIDMNYTTRRINETLFVYHVVLGWETISANTTLFGHAESIIIYRRGATPTITYNITGTNTTLVNILDAMDKNILLAPLLATNIVENRGENGGNATITGRATAANASLVAEGWSHIVISGSIPGKAGYLPIILLRQKYNLTADYSEPLSKIIKRIFAAGLNGYRGEKGVEALLQSFIQGIAAVPGQPSIHVMNNILALSLVMNWTSLRLDYGATNESYVLDMATAAKASFDSLPMVYMASCLAARGYRASSIGLLLSRLNSIINGSGADPAAALRSVKEILGSPIYSLSPEIYLGDSGAVLRAEHGIPSSSREIIGRLKGLLGITANITVSGDEIIVQPFPGPREDLAVYMALKNIEPAVTATTTTTASTTPLTTTSTITSKQAETVNQEQTGAAKTAATSSTSRPGETATHQSTSTGGALLERTTTHMGQPGAGPAVSPLIILVPVAAFALIILYLHCTAKKRVLEQLVGEQEEPAGQGPEGEE